MFKKSNISNITPRNGYVLLKVEIDGFSVFQLAGDRNLSGTKIEFSVEASSVDDLIPGDKVLVEGNIFETAGGFLDNIGNNRGFREVAAMHKSLSQKDREIFNKNTPKVKLVDFLLVMSHMIKAVID